MSSGQSLRPDIAAAKARMSIRLGSNREIKKLVGYLRDGERVEQMVAGYYGNGNGLLVLTNLRVLFLLHGVFVQRSEDFPIERISSVQWSTGPIFGVVTIFASGNKAEIRQVEKNGGKAIVDRLRQRLSHRL